MSTHAEIETEVIAVIRRELRVVNRRLDGRTRLDTLGADSIALVKLTLTFEEAFDIEIPDEEADRIRTVQDAVASIETYVRAGHPEQSAGDDVRVHGAPSRVPTGPTAQQVAHDNMAISSTK
jgi:acyl carrier protein